MINALEGLITELREVGLPISVSEKMDAARALDLVDLADRGEVKYGLSATLVKNAEHQSAFDTVFDLYFARRSALLDAEEDAAIAAAVAAAAESDDDEEAVAVMAGGGGRRSGGGSSVEQLDDATIRRLLIDSLAAGDSSSSLLQRRLASIIVERHAGIQPGRAVAGTYYLYRAMRAVNPDNVLATLVREAGAEPGADDLNTRLMAEEFQRRIDAFRQEVEAEIRRQLVADRGVDAVAKTLRQPLPEDVDFLTASGQQIRALREVLAPLSQKLAARMGERRRHKRQGGVDFRKTIRESLSNGGVPLDLHYHKPRPAKPELIVLADISGSVSAFAAFTLQLTYALRAQFARVRSFVFVDGLDEVTDLVSGADEILQVTAEINKRGLGVWFDGRSDYGNAIDTFWNRHGGELRHRTTLLILGDARSNYHSPRADVLGKITSRVGHTYWLNPEPKAAWDSGDSIISQYAKVCDETLECRNVRQLRNFIELLE